MNLSELSLGQSAIIKSFTNEELSLKLMEMGCLPEEKVSVTRIAPLGDPIIISVSGYLLSLRKEEAAMVEVALVQ